MRRFILVLMTVFFMLPHANLMAGEKIGALGRIKPGGMGDGMVHLGMPGQVISRILVDENEFVAKGTPLVVFQSQVANQFKVDQAKLDLKESVAKRKQSIDLKTLEIEKLTAIHTKLIELQNLKIEAAKESYEFAQQRFDRFDRVGEEFFTEKQIKQGRHELKLLKLKLDQTEKELERLDLAHNIQMNIAAKELKAIKINQEIKVKRAEKQLEIALDRLEQSTLRAPIDGTILTVFQKVGEKSGSAVLRMAPLTQMYVIGEIFENDLLKLSPGMKATITSKALPEPITGKIESISRMIDSKSKIGRIKIRLDNSQTAAKLIHLEVNISIDL